METCFAGHLNIKDRKMSKSLKNFITIRSVSQHQRPSLLSLIRLIAKHQYCNVYLMQLPEVNLQKNVRHWLLMELFS